VASLYADLRAQSLVSGGVPIAVRHIESVVRMSEAFAKMHLRDHVRDDDVDNAIKVMLESFIQAQKVSVRRSLQKSFRKYITFGEEKNNLLMHELQQMIRTKENFGQIRYQKTSQTVVVFIDELESRAKTLNVYDLRPFFGSALFRNHGMHVDESQGVIIKSF
jgi:DNA replication licensing factor MCM2